MATRRGEDDHGVTLSHVTTRPEGDFAIGAEAVGLHRRRRAVVDRPWVWLRQVHGADVVTVTRDNLDQATGAGADALVTAEPEVVLAVQTADCVPLSLASRAGVVGVVHAGWRGLESGVIETAVGAMRELGAESIDAQVGPFIGPECYEFGAADLDRLAGEFGDEVRAATSWGTPALDLGWMVQVALHRAGVAGPPRSDWTHGHGCTACRADRWFSYRARAEPERMATVIWRERSDEQSRAHP
jgi:polyphenol oxidase